MSERYLWDLAVRQIFSSWLLRADEVNDLSKTQEGFLQ